MGSNQLWKSVIYQMKLSNEAKFLEQTDIVTHLDYVRVIDFMLNVVFE
jgi:hypothetical protein